MREIKFRAWNVWLKKMYKWDELVIPFLTSEIKWLEIMRTNNCFQTHMAQGDTLMQYTWLKDKNWVEIYEGDVLRVSMERDLQDSPYVVDCIQELYLQMNRDDNYYRIDDFPEIMWNIYENPTLLETN